MASALMKKHAAATLLLLAFQSLRLQAALSDGLVGYWRFDEGQGSVANDSSGNGSPGTLMNMPADSSEWVAGQVGGALHFRGTATRDYVNIPSFSRPDSTMTLTAWVWADSIPQWASIASCFGGVTGPFYFGMLGSDDIISGYSTDSSGLITTEVYANTLLTLGTWHFVALRIRSTTIDLWQDGERVGSELANGTMESSSLPLEIGGETHFDYPFQGFWDGKIDDVALWNRALDKSELQAIYANGLDGQGVLPVPEPTATTLLVLGLGALAWIFQNRRGSNSAVLNTYAKVRRFSPDR